MDTIKTITSDVLRDIAFKTGFDQSLIVKDYYITVLLYLLKDIDGLYFKGGTALQKIFLNYSRLSEDIDFTITKNVNLIRKQIEKVIKKSGMFGKVTKDKHVHKFIRLIIHYKDPFNEKGTVFIDLNKKSELLKKPEKYNIKHFYGENIPSFSFFTLAKDEMITEKVSATINRNKPRDHFDVYSILSNNISLNLSMVKKKCQTSGGEFNIVKIFSKAKKLKKRWDEDMNRLLAEEVSFSEVMKTLARYFKLKEKLKKR